MKLTIVAATGRIGRVMLEQAVADGHDVTAVAWHPETLPAGVRSGPTATGCWDSPLGCAHVRRTRDHR